MSHEKHIPEDKEPRNWLLHPELVVAMIILLAFLVLCTLQVVTRFILPIPLSWTEELTAALVIWMTLLGAIAVQRTDSHIRVDLMREICSARWVAIIYGLFDFLSLICLGAIVLGGWHTLSETSYQKTPALGISYNLIMSVVPLASIVMAVFLVLNAVRRFKRLKSKDAQND
ncbi:TRAP transporter small permease [uncultured Celeribacter sp.]|uniref:TRAP transporter small permease n=1 Tax=uncultured Celeribacter sp. TaxID=1303376 RepID=UPI002AA687CF|nr:TRAP transporter small permease [uncultured Celeribacter sp.]